jgi:hypothetical protein
MFTAILVAAALVAALLARGAYMYRYARGRRRLDKYCRRE